MTVALRVDLVTEINRHVTKSAGKLIAPDKLASALGRPMHTFAGQAMYPTVATRAGALLDGLVAAHAFTDGNKRTAWIAAKTYLRLHGVAPSTPEPITAARFVEGIALHRHNAETASVWIAEHLMA